MSANAVPDSLTAPVHRLLAAGFGLEQSIVELQRMGFTKEQAALALHRATTLPLPEMQER
jgi:hypothetical protein